MLGVRNWLARIAWKIRVALCISRVERTHGEAPIRPVPAVSLTSGYRFPLGVLFAIFFLLVNSPTASAAELTGQVLDPQGLRIVNAQVRLFTPGAASGKAFHSASSLREAVSDGRGEFEFRNLEPGAYRLGACAAGFQCQELPLQIGDSGATITIGLPVAGVYEGVVVTATRQEEETSETPLASALLSSQTLERQGALNLAQALESIPGVNWTNAGSFRSRPVIRGLDSNRVLVLVDGERLNNSRTSTVDTGIETSLVDLSQVEQMEVVRGPGSVLYGSDALGGVVNIRTRGATPSETTRFGARLGAEFFPNSDGRRTNVELSGSNRWLAARAAGSLGSINDYHSPVGRIYGSGVDENGALGEIRLYPSHQHSFFGKFLHRGAYDFAFPSLEPNPSSGLITFPFSKLQKFSGGYGGNFRSRWFSAVQVRLYSQDQTRDLFSDVKVSPVVHSLSNTVTRIETRGLDLQVTGASSRHLLTYGSNAYRDRSQESRLQLRQSASGQVTVTSRAPSTPNSTFSNFGLFLQDQFELSRRLRLMGGIRLDRFGLNASETENFDPNLFTTIQRRQIDTAWSGSLGGNLTIRSGWIVTSHLARAFREPNLFERYFVGPAPSRGGFVIPNPDLKPETSTQLDLGIRVHHRALRVSANYFLSQVKDLINKTLCSNLAPPCSFPGQTDVRQNVNINRARIQGIESTVEMFLSGLGSQWTPMVATAWQQGTDRRTGQRLSFIAPFVAQAGLRWAPRGSRAWSEWQMRVAKGTDHVAIGERPISGYTTMAWRGGYELTHGERGLGARLPGGVSSINFHLGIENLTNRLYRGLFESLVQPVPQPGRELRFGMTLNLDSYAH